MLAGYAGFAEEETCRTDCYGAVGTVHVCGGAGLQRGGADRWDAGGGCWISGTRVWDVSDEGEEGREKGGSGDSDDGEDHCSTAAG